MASILLVCTGNICRTPMAEGFLREHVRSRMRRDDIEVFSAGVIAAPGRSATPEAVAAALERDVDIDSHRARRLSSEVLARADLVVCMAEEHVEAIGKLDPQALRKTFTLKELLHVARELPPPAEGAVSDEDLRRRVADADAHRRADPAPPHDLDISDPLGMSIDTYRATAWELDTLLGELVDAFLGRAPARTSIWD